MTMTQEQISKKVEEIGIAGEAYTIACVHYLDVCEGLYAIAHGEHPADSPFPEAVGMLEKMQEAIGEIVKKMKTWQISEVSAVSKKDLADALYFAACFGKYFKNRGPKMPEGIDAETLKQYLAQHDKVAQRIMEKLNVQA